MRPQVPTILAWLALAACDGRTQAQHDERGVHLSSGAQSPAPSERHQDTSAPSARKHGRVASAVSWFKGGLDQALDQAKAEDKLVFVDVGADWCPPCKELDEKTFTDARVGRWLGSHALALHIDAETAEGAKLVERYEIQAYPTLLLLEASGLEKARLTDFIAPEALLTQLEALANGTDLATL